MFCSASRAVKRIVSVLCALVGSLRPRPLAPLISGLALDGGLVLGQWAGDIGEEQTPKSWPLKENQLKQLHSWLHSHRSHWKMVLATPPLPSFSILLNQSDGVQRQIDFYSKNESWQHVIGMSVWDREGTFLFGGQMWQPIEEITMLKTLLIEENQGKAF